MKQILFAVLALSIASVSAKAIRISYEDKIKLVSVNQIETDVTSKLTAAVKTKNVKDELSVLVKRERQAYSKLNNAEQAYLNKTIASDILETLRKEHEDAQAKLDEALSKSPDRLKLDIESCL